MSQKVPDILRLVKIIASLISPTCSEHGSTLWWRDLRKNVQNSKFCSRPVEPPVDCLFVNATF